MNIKSKIRYYWGVLRFRLGLKKKVQEQKTEQRLEIEPKPMPKYTGLSRKERRRRWLNSWRKYKL